jgi:Rps23 Pro-64 3,4-dihydroxylase Tpa1-like proline 4-hydroxylase
MELKMFHKDVKIEQIIKSSTYKNAIPFPHVYFDNLFDKEELDKILEDIEYLNHKKWWKYDNIFEKKKAYNNFQNMGNYLQKYFNFVNGKVFVRLIESITGINNLISDPSLYGGGIHMIEKGGKLDIHEDFNYHKITGWKRKINIITFLNKEWKEDYGGHTEFWDKNMKECNKKILPVFNRTVLFCTDQDSFHGHPDPLNCPSNRKRLSLATYYYINYNHDNKQTNIRSTSYKKRPNDITNNEIEKMRSARKEGRLKI